MSKQFENFIISEENKKMMEKLGIKINSKNINLFLLVGSSRRIRNIKDSNFNRIISDKRLEIENSIKKNMR